MYRDAVADAGAERRWQEAMAVAGAALDDRVWRWTNWSNQLNQKEHSRVDQRFLVRLAVAHNWLDITRPPLIGVPHSH